MDAPELVDDYYLNLLDWGNRNVIAVALGNKVYMWNACTESVDLLLQTEEDENIVTSVSFSPTVPSSPDTSNDCREIPLLLVWMTVRFKYGTSTGK